MVKLQYLLRAPAARERESVPGSGARQRRTPPRERPGAAEAHLHRRGTAPALGGALPPGSRRPGVPVGRGGPRGGRGPLERPPAGRGRRGGLPRRRVGAAGLPPRLARRRRHAGREHAHPAAPTARPDRRRVSAAVARRPLALALEVHPLWNYVRNVVVAPVLSGSPPLCGIVEEQFRTRGELLDPVRFFGGWLQDGPQHVPRAHRRPRLPGPRRARELPGFGTLVAGLTSNAPRRSVSASVAVSSCQLCSDFVEEAVCHHHYPDLRSTVEMFPEGDLPRPPPGQAAPKGIHVLCRRSGNAFHVARFLRSQGKTRGAVRVWSHRRPGRRLPPPPTPGRTRPSRFRW